MWAGPTKIQVTSLVTSWVNWNPLFPTLSQTTVLLKNFECTMFTTMSPNFTSLGSKPMIPTILKLVMLRIKVLGLGSWSKWCLSNGEALSSILQLFRALHQMHVTQAPLLNTPWYQKWVPKKPQHEYLISYPQHNP